MDATQSPPPMTPPFRQPKPLIRWLAVILAAGGWYVSWQLLRVSRGAGADNAFLQAVCGGTDAAGGVNGCGSVLNSPQAYVQITRDSNAPRIPVAALGMGYFAVVGLWYLLIGPPARRGRAWHLLILTVVLIGAWQSLDFIALMKFTLRQWCTGCLIAHGFNGGLLLLTLLAWPWRRTAATTWTHPTGRLVLGAVTAGVFAFLTHFTMVYVYVAGNMLRERTAQYATVLNDPEFLVWDFNRQAAASIPLREDEIFGGDPAAPNTVVVFGDFQCEHCRKAHDLLQQLAAKHAGSVRVAFRYYPEDAACNPLPRFRAGSHASACRAARAAEAARLIGGSDAFMAMRQKIWEHQADLPRRVRAQQSEAEKRLFEDWAAECGLERAAFAAALDSAAAGERIREDLDLAKTLGVESVPVVYVNGKRLRGWSKLETWDAILRGTGAATTQP